MESGDAFGEISFLLATPATADVVAITDVSVLEISAEAIQRLIRQRPGVAAVLYRSLAAELARRLVKMSDRIAQEPSPIEGSPTGIAVVITAMA
jgi:CRP-like cAMP-binding protein